jgi:hypothetical protein
VISFAELHWIRKERLKIRGAPPILLSFDPGATTGACVFEGTKLTYAVHLPSADLQLAVTSFTRFIDRYNPTEVVMEDYKVYPHYAKQHVGSNLLTPRLIGAIEVLCDQRQIPYHKQMAGDPKRFVTDIKLKEWGFYYTGLKHARDAIRHGCFYLLFPPKVRTSEIITRVTGSHHVG